MKAKLLIAAAALAPPAFAADVPVLSPGEIVAAAPASEWVPIPPDDLLVMDLVPGAAGQPRRIVIQLMPPPFSQPWISNIRTLAKAHWWDGLAIVRTQDNYVVQWGDPDAENPAAAKALPSLLPTREQNYVEALTRPRLCQDEAAIICRGSAQAVSSTDVRFLGGMMRDPYFGAPGFFRGWAVSTDGRIQSIRPDAAESGGTIWPVHCYGMVGVGRNLSPDAGNGAELYAVIGHAPRHLDRNIALVGRVIDGIENLSTLPRGTEALGFYKTPEERTQIASIRMGSEVADVPAYEFLSTEGTTFPRYADARANRRDPFFIVPAGGADVCNIPVPVRRASAH